MTAVSQRRLFFALWPDADVRARLNAVAGQSVTAGRRTLPTAFHMTLVFLGERDPGSYARILTAPDGLACPAFDLYLDRLGYFPRARVLWLGPDDIPPELSALFVKLNERLACAGAAADGREADPVRYRPHVTLARKAVPPTAQARAAVTPVRWRVNGFALVESNPGLGPSSYQVLKRW